MIFNNIRFDSWRTVISTNIYSILKTMMIITLILVSTLVNAQSYTLKYLANTPDGETVTGMPNPNSYSYSSSTTVTTPSAPICEGYTFTGWYYDGSGTAYNEDFTSAGCTWSAGDIFTTPLMDIYLTAQWNPIPTLSKVTEVVSSVGEDGDPTDSLRWENTLTITGDASFKQLDVVLILDISSSMFNDENGTPTEGSTKITNVKAAASDFIEELIEAGHRIALVFFNDGVSHEEFSTDADDLVDRINLISLPDVFKGTNITKGVDRALKLIDDRSSQANEVVTLLLGDGAPTRADYLDEYGGSDPIYVNMRRLDRFYISGKTTPTYNSFGVDLTFDDSDDYYHIPNPNNYTSDYIPVELIGGRTYGDGFGFQFIDEDPTEGYIWPELSTSATASTKGYFNRELAPVTKNYQYGGYDSFHTDMIKPFADPNNPFTFSILEQITHWSADKLKEKSELYVVGFDLHTNSIGDEPNAPIDFFSSLNSDNGTYTSADIDGIESVISTLSEKISMNGYQGVLEDNLPTYLDLEIPENAIEDPTDLYSWNVIANTDGVDREYTLTYNAETSLIRCDVGNLDFNEPIVFTYYTTLADHFDYTDSSLGTSYDSEGNLILNLPLNGETSLEYFDNTNTNEIISVDPPIGDIPVSLSIEKRVVSADAYETITAEDGVVTDDEFDAISEHDSDDPLVSKDVYYIFRVTNNSYEEVQNIIINDMVTSISGSDKIFPTADPFELKEKDDEDGDDSRIFVWDQKFGDDYSITENTATLEIKPQGATDPLVIQFESNTVFVERPYTVTYDDGVSDSDPDQVVVGTVPSSETAINAAEMGTPAAPTRDGYQFTGWKYEGATTLKDFDNSTVRITPGDNFDALISTTAPAYLMPASDFTLTAQWVAVYTLTYDDGVAENDTEVSEMPDPTSSLEQEGDVAVVSELPVRSKMTFVGWSTDDNNNGVVDNSEVLYNYGDNFPMPAADEILYAIWEERDFGDLPIGYKIDGQTPAYHTIKYNIVDGVKENTLQLGTTVDHELATIYSDNSDGDDLDGIDDETGVSIEYVLEDDQIKMRINASVKSPFTLNYFINGWMDFNNDYTLSQNGLENVFNNRNINQPTAIHLENEDILLSNLKSSYPNLKDKDQIFGRFRVSHNARDQFSLETNNGDQSRGMGGAEGGEVEDYSFTIRLPIKVSYLAGCTETVDNIPATEMQFPDDTYSLPQDANSLNVIPERDGYLFAGWKTDVALVAGDEETPASYAVGDVINTSDDLSDSELIIIPSSDINFTAQWDKIYKITFDPSGGTSSGDIDQIKDDSGNVYFRYTANTLGVTAKEPIRDGYEFLGWHWNGATIEGYNSDFTLDVDNYFDSNITDAYSMPASDLTLYALWGSVDTDISSKGVSDSDFVSYPNESNSEEKRSIDYKLTITPEAYKTATDVMGFSEIAITIPMPNLDNGNLKAYATSRSFSSLSVDWAVKYYDSSDQLTSVFEEVTTVKLVAPYSSTNLYNSTISDPIEFEFSLDITEDITTARKIRLDYTVTVETEHSYGTKAIAEVSDIAITNVNPVWNVIYHNTDFTSGVVPVDANDYLEDEEVKVLGNSGNLIRSSYTFGGWTTDDITGTDQEFNTGLGDGIVDFEMPNKNVDFYPVWIPDGLYVETVDVDNIGQTEAKLYGKAISGVDIEYYGFIYSADKYLPADLVYGGGDVKKIENSIALNPTEEAVNLGAFSTGDGDLAALSALINRKGCYFRAFIKQSDGTIAYGEVIRFITEKRDFSLELDGNSRLIADENATDVIGNWNGDNHFAVDFWIKTDLTDHNSVIIDMESNSKGYSISLDSSGKINISNTAGGLGVSADQVDDGEWHHIAISCDNSTTIFIDGAVSSTSAITYLEPTEQHNMIIGDGFSGNLDALRFWNKPLVEDQVKMLIYDNIQASTDSKVELIGSGDKVSDLAWDNLTASFGFNVCSTLEKTPITPSTIIYQDDDSDDPSVNNLKGNRFFHEDFKHRINLAVIGSAKPSVDLPRVNWKHNATNNSWTESDSWSGYAYPGEGINDDEIDLETYLDVTTTKIEDNYSYAKYSVINRADVATSIPQVKRGTFFNGEDPLGVDVLVDMDNSVGTYYVTTTGELTILGEISRDIFSSKIVNRNGGVIKVYSGSIEPHQD